VKQASRLFNFSVQRAYSWNTDISSSLAFGTQRARYLVTKGFERHDFATFQGMTLEMRNPKTNKAINSFRSYTTKHRHTIYLVEAGLATDCSNDLLSSAAILLN
jgi:hypothetical protein